MMARDPSTLPGAPRTGVVGVVLAGGESRRMGSDKARLPWGETTLGGHALARLAAVCDEVVVADRGRGAIPGARSVPDGPGAGPAAGLLGAAAAVPGRGLLVLACDLPSVPVALLHELQRVAGTADLVVPVSPRGIEPLAGYYGPAALAVLDRAVARGELALHPLLECGDLRIVRLATAELARFGDPAAMFRNVNTRPDLDAARDSGSAG